MVRHSKKAPKGDDAFKTKKQKVGRKKLAPATSTRAEVHARTLRINNAIVVDNEEEEKNDGVIPHRNFAENVSASNHYRANVRSGAIGSMVAQVAEEGKRLSPVHRLQALIIALSNVADTDKTVRQRAVSLVENILKFADADSQTLVNILQYTHIALTHAVFDVRRSGLEVIRAVLTHWPQSLRRGNVAIDSIQIIDRVFEISSASAQPDFATLALLLDELLADDSSQGSTLCTAMSSFLERNSASILVRWKEHMEQRYALFREPRSVERACALARVVSTIGIFLLKQNCLGKVNSRFLREMFIARVPFTMEDLCSGNNPRSVDFASAVATGCVPLLQNINDDALRCVNIFLTTSISVAPLASSVGHLALVTSIVPQLNNRFCGLMPPLLQTLSRQVSNKGFSCTLVLQCASLLEVFMGVVDPPVDMLQHLASCLHLVCRVLFACRRFDRDAARDVGKCFLGILWNTVASRHPVMSVVDVRSFTDALQSIFGVGNDNQFVKGILETIDDEEITALGAHIFHYLQQPPQSLSVVLPVGVPLSNCSAV
ncbi:60S ribosome maturation protein, Ipi-1, putative [Bodo saltans]|uniref:60S ribosome maturation protein, Ipi-1, putative n=1 Tax=Bodo saltans TaxID=75058 RepID=A0A0S4IQJ2_BODSA|nr:60S ribosome maturation protein, Ipi-1, putative [Bodo saltans]|eukprot:CUF96134.1 60S ribosome maturation protein, Ipi-1, putative [Bodo saltans]